MFAIGIVLAIAFVITAIGVVLSFIPLGKNALDPGRLQRVAIAAASTFVILMVVDWIWLYVYMPPLLMPAAALFVMWNLIVPLMLFGWADFEDRPNAAAVVSGIVLVGLVATLVLWNNHWYLGQQNADMFVGTMNPEIKDPGTYPNTSSEHMVIVGDQAARNIATQALNDPQFGTFYQLREGVLQSVAGHMYYVFELKPSNIQNANAANQHVSGFIAVDAEDPNAPPIKKAGYQLRYVIDGDWSMSLQRYMWDQGVRDLYTDHWTFEVDDNWRPFYTASLNRPLFRWQDAVPVEFIMVDPQTGVITRLPLDRVPAWVDRVYSADMVKTMLSWWGQWGEGPQKAGWQWVGEAPANRYKVDPESEPNVVYTEDGPAWQVMLTSFNNDASASWVALFDTRSNRVRLYRAFEGMGLEKKVGESFGGSDKNLAKLEPTSAALHKIEGRLVWVASMVKPGEASQENDGYPKAVPFTGIGLLSAINPSGAAVIIGKDKSDALTQLKRNRVIGVDNTAPNPEAQDKSTEGTVSHVDPAVINGQTVLIVSLAGDNDHIYRGEVRPDNIDSLKSVRVKEGDRVTITYVDDGSPVRGFSKLTISSSLTTASPAG